MAAIKTSFSKYNIEGYENGVPVNKSFIDFSESLDYKYTDAKDQSDVILNIDGDKLDNTIVSNHFFVQHFRIPKLEKYNLSVIKVLQLAYNVGQLKAVFEHENVFDKNIKNFYRDNRLGDISTYIPLDAQNRHLVEKNSNQSGGQYR